MKKQNSFSKGSQKDSNKVNVFGEVLCACNGLPCGGECREIHLVNERTGTCVAAYNKPKPRFVPKEEDPEEDYFGSFQDWDNY